MLSVIEVVCKRIAGDYFEEQLCLVKLDGRLDETLASLWQILTCVYDVLTTEMGLHPFTTYVLRRFYEATGWNEDNRYSNLTRSSDGELFVCCVAISCLISSSDPRLCRPSRPPILNCEGA